LKFTEIPPFCPTCNKPEARLPNAEAEKILLKPIVMPFALETVDQISNPFDRFNGFTKIILLQG
jgi:hypothetical protein